MSGYRNNLDVREALLTRILEQSLELILPNTQAECLVLQGHHQELLKNMEANSLEVRHTEMEAKANLAHDTANLNQQKNLNAIRIHEARLAMYRKVKAVRSKHNKSGFTSIEVPSSWPAAHTDMNNIHDLPNPKDATEWKTIDLPDEIVYYLLTRNRLHFGQAKGTPLTDASFTREVNWMASTDSAELILNGDYTSNELTDLQSFC